MKGRDIILFPVQPWDQKIGTNTRNMARVMNKGNRILYVNRPLDRITTWRKKNPDMIKARMDSIKGREKSLQEVEPNIWVLNPRVMLESVNFLPPGKIYDFLIKRNIRLLAKEIQTAMDELNFKADILLVDNDFLNGVYLSDFLKPRVFIYYIRDYLRALDYFKKHGLKSEPEIMRKADAVLGNSHYLTNYAKQFNPKSYYVGQGCEVDLFRQVPEGVPEELAGIQVPIIGYCGSLTAQRLDIGLIEYIASSFPEYKIALVGREDDDEFRNSKLHQMPNVIFTGHKDAMSLPAYVHNFDICMNPQLVNEMTIGNYPRKIDEYLVTGKPILATKTIAMMDFEEVTYLGETKEDYVENIKKALKEKDDAELIRKRKAVGEDHSWENSVQRMYDVIEKF